MIPAGDRLSRIVLIIKQDTEKEIGTVRLSSSFPVLLSSTYVDINTDGIAMNKFKLIKSIIIIDEEKKTREPSKVFSPIEIFPIFFPINAARASEMLIMHRDAIAMFVSKKDIRIHDENNMYDAPVSFLSSNSLVIEEKKIS